MNKEQNITNSEFAYRLKCAMSDAGYATSRSPSGICIKTLAKVTESSEQICRRYIRGDALPDYDKILKIAQFCHVSPGWLLFGDKNDSGETDHSVLKIDPHLLHYILDKSHALNSDPKDDYPAFVIDLIRNISAIETSHDNLKKIIDIAVGSISSFNEKQSSRA